MSLDSEIQDLEHRLAQRKLKVELLARATGRRAVRSLVSPAGLIGAAALGFLAVTGVTRRQHYRAAPAARSRRLAGLAGVSAAPRRLGATAGRLKRAARISLEGRLMSRCRRDSCAPLRI